MTTRDLACPDCGAEPGQPCPTSTRGIGCCAGRFLAARKAERVGALRDVAVPIDPTPSRFPWRR